jgi:uncharacterized protein (TIGR03067 family)
MSAKRTHSVRCFAMAANAVLGFGLLVAGPQLAVCQDSKATDSKVADSKFRQLDTSGDGVLTMDDATAGTRSFLERIFKEAGKEPTGQVTHEEFVAASESLRNKSSSGSSKSPPSSTEATAESGDPPAGIGFVDSNGDGAVSRAEWSKFAQTFSRLDTDKDNSLNETELEATGGAAKLLAKLADLNGDGKVTRVEWTKLVQSFARLDANRDKSLELVELEKAADAALASASGSASLGGDAKSGAKSGPVLWRGRIEGRGQIELLVDGNVIVGRESGRGGGGDGLGTGTFSMTGDGKTGNMDAVYTEGMHAGEACLGIYRLDGNTLTWCVNNRGGRPQSFSGGGGNWLLTLTRVDADPTTKKAL